MLFLRITVYDNFRTSNGQHLLDGIPVENREDKSKEIEDVLPRQANYLPKCVSMTNVFSKSLEFYEDDNRILRCFSYTDLSQNSLETYQKLCTTIG